MKERGVHSHRHQVRATNLCLVSEDVAKVAVAAGMNDSLNRRVQLASSHATVRFQNLPIGGKPKL
jgi:hypothetical protein